MFKVSLYYILQLQLWALNSASASGINDSQAAKSDFKHKLRETNPADYGYELNDGTDLVVDISYIMQLPNDQNGTECIGTIIDSETIVTSQACKVPKSDANSNSPYRIADIIEDPLRIPLAAQTLRLNPPMTLGVNFVHPTLIDTKERYEELKDEDRVGIAMATKGPKMGLVWWYDQMTSGSKGKNESFCEVDYSILRENNPGWPDSLPEGIFCIRGGHQDEGFYTAVVEGKNVTIGPILRDDVPMGSPILIPNEGLLGIVTAACSDSYDQLIYAQSLAYINITRDEQKNQTTEEPEKTSTLQYMVGEPLTVYPVPSQYLASPFIKVIKPTPSSANHIWDFKMSWTTWLLACGLKYQRFMGFFKI